MQKFVLALLVATVNARQLKHHNKGHIKSMKSFKDQMALKGVKHAKSFFQVDIRETDIVAAEETAAHMETTMDNYAGEENFETFATKVQSDMTALENSDEVQAFLTWHQENSDSADWDADTQEVMAEYEAHLSKVNSTAQALEQYAERPDFENQDMEIVGDAGDRTISIEVPDAQWNAFNDEVAATKAFELQTLKNLPMMKQFRQHLLNIKFSDSFKDLEADFTQFTGNSQIESFTRSLETLTDQIKALPRLTEEGEALMAESAVVTEVCLMMDLMLDSMKTGSLDKVADYMINGETDGVLTETVDAPQTDASTNETSTNTTSNTNETNGTAEKASGLFAAVTTAVVAFAATQF